ncbi:MAG: hypothetical protein H6604_03325 [Flavobacteriales bacterium]|nr:hypothetical protein [Flavobacteriales bacterium]
MMKTLKIYILLLVSSSLAAQVGIGTGDVIDAGAVLEVKSTNQGVLLPRISDHSAVTSPTNGLLIYDETDQCINYYAAGAWVNPCAGTGGAGTFTSLCGDGYSSVEMKNVETSGNLVSLGVSADGNLYYTGSFSANRQFGNTGTSPVYDWTKMSPTSWSADSVIDADLSIYAGTLVNNRSTQTAVATTGGIYISQAGVSSGAYTLATYGGVTPTEIELGNGVVVVDANGDVYYAAHATPTVFNKVTFFDTAGVGGTDLPIEFIKTENNDGYLTNSGNSYNHFAWSSSDPLNRLFYFANDSSVVNSYSFPSPVVDFDSEPTANSALILLEDGSMYAMGGASTFGLSTTTSTPLLISPVPFAAGTRPLDAGEKFINIETGYLDAYAVTNLGNFYSMENTDDVWYHEYEIAASDPTTVDISAFSINYGAMFVIDGRYWTWGTQAADTSSTTGGNSGKAVDTMYGIAHSNANLNSPVSANICEAN